MPRSIKKLVGQRIRELRERRGWSQERLAEEANLHRNYIGQIERGEKNMGVENLVRIAKALGVSTSSLLSRL